MQPLSSSGTITPPQEIHYTHHSAISTPITEKTPIFDAGGYYHAVHHEMIKVSSEKEIGEALLKAKESSKKIQ